MSLATTRPCKGQAGGQSEGCKGVSQVAAFTGDDGPERGWCREVSNAISTVVDDGGSPYLCEPKFKEGLMENACLDEDQDIREQERLKSKTNESSDSREVSRAFKPSRSLVALPGIEPGFED